MHSCCIHSNSSFVKAAKSSFVNNNKLLYDDQPLSKKRCLSYAFTLLFFSIAERTGTANGMATGTATGMATAGMATEVTVTGVGMGGDVDIVMG
jgi:hypothetical protein